MGLHVHVHYLEALGLAAQLASLQCAIAGSSALCWNSRTEQIQTFHVVILGFCGG